MAFKLIWSPSARLDLKDIAAYIAEDSPLALINGILVRINMDFEQYEKACTRIRKENAQLISDVAKWLSEKKSCRPRQ